MDGGSCDIIPLKPGLYLVATPIGNLRDITLRALDVLKQADFIACEDTRVSLKLLNHYDIKAKLLCYHEHNEVQAGEKILAYLEQGRTVALISDAGTPLMSDPGFKLVKQAREHDYFVCAIPGANAALTALVAAGLPVSEFYFVGFLPAKAKPRQAKLAQLASYNSTLIFYESPARLCQTLADMCYVFGGDTIGAICRELTKKFEEYDVAALADLHKKYSNISHKLGEIVILIDASSVNKVTYDIDEINKLSEMYKDLAPSKLASLIAKITDQPKADIYKILSCNKKNAEN